MNTLSSQKQYEEISFNNECSKDQQITNNNFYHDLMTNQQKIQHLLQKVLQLQSQLQKQKQKSSQLQKRNQQLTDMLISASQANVKRNQHFIRQVQRKIYNFKAKKQLIQNNFDSFNKKNEQEQPYQIRIKTQSTYESQKSLQKLPNKKGRISQQGFQKNKENLNYLNQKTTLQVRNHSKNQLKRKDDFRLENLTERSFNKSKGLAIKSSGFDELMYRGSNKVDLKRDMKIINKIQTKLMRN